MSDRHERVRTVREALAVPLGRLPRPTLILLCGLPGTGKSHLAQRLVRHLPLVVVSTDQVRHVLFAEPTYNGQEHHIVHQTCQTVVAQLLAEGHSVICDATNLERRHRERYYALAEEQNARLFILQTVAPPEVVRRRIEDRQQGDLAAHNSDAGWEVYERYRSRMEPIRRPHRVVDTSGDLDAQVAEIVRQLAEEPAPLPGRLRGRVIMNPAAGQSHRLSDLDETLGYLVRQGWELSLYETHRPNQAGELARQAATEGLDVVLVVGGDGTVNEVVNGLAGSNTALAVLPMGTGNVWAREQGISLEPIEAARELLQGQVRTVDLGLAGSRYFLLMASVGFDAAVVRALSGEGKQAFWPLGYILKGITIALNFAGKETVVTLDDREVDAEALFIVIGNTRLYGGVVQITHQATMDDGLLDVCIFRGKGGLSLLSLYALAAVLKMQERTGGVDYYRAREVTVSSETPLHVQTDGEAIGTTPMTFRVVPRSLRVLVPREFPPGLFSTP